MADTEPKKVVTSEDIEANATDARKPKRRRLRAAAPSIREQSEQAAAKADQPVQRSLIARIVRFPFLVIFWPFRMLYRYVIQPPFRYLNKFKFFRVIGYIFVPPYFRQSWRELRLVTWPNFRETYSLVIAVIIFSIIFGVIVALVDYGLDKLFRAVILDK